MLVIGSNRGMRVAYIKLTLFRSKHEVFINHPTLSYTVLSDNGLLYGSIRQLPLIWLYQPTLSYTALSDNSLLYGSISQLSPDMALSADALLYGSISQFSHMVLHLELLMYISNYYK